MNNKTITLRFRSFSRLLVALMAAGAAGELLAGIDKPVFQCGSGADIQTGKYGDHQHNAGDIASLFTRDKNGGYTLFESGPVRPLALSDDKQLLFVTNVPADCLEIYDVSSITGNQNTADDAMVLASTVAVGVDPVSVAVRNSGEVWVVNHISDSVSIVKWGASDAPHVAETLLVGDEPRDIVFADDGSGANNSSETNSRNRAFITTAVRGQHDAGFNSMDLFNAPEASATEGTAGLARVWSFDAENPTGSAPDRLKLFTTAPRALAVSADGSTVYAAGFLSGNGSTLSNASQRELALMGVTSTEDGLLLISSDVIVRKDADGHYRDETMLNDRTNDDSELVWDDFVGKVTDRDVFKINVSDYSVESVTGVGTTLFNMVVSGTDVLVSNTDARNHVRFVADGSTDPSQPVGEKLKGHFVEHNITRIPAAAWSDQVNNPLVINHLNGHIDYNDADQAQFADESLAQPVDMVADNGKLYVAAYGSRRIGVMNLSNDSMLRNEYIDLAGFSSNSNDGVGGGGPAGLVMADGTLFVYTRFDNAVRAINVASKAELVEASMSTPESALVVNGRPFLYDANISSANGTGACASCHAYGDFDLLAWDLGNLKGNFHSTETLPMNQQNPLGGSTTFLSDVSLMENGNSGTWMLGGGYFPSTAGLQVNQPVTVKGELTGELLADDNGSDIFTEASNYDAVRVAAENDQVTSYEQYQDKVYLINQTRHAYGHLNLFKSLPFKPSAFDGLKNNWVDGDYICLDGREPVLDENSGHYMCDRYEYSCVSDGSPVKDPMRPIVQEAGMECVAGRHLEESASAVDTYRAYKARWDVCVAWNNCGDYSGSSDPADWLNAHVQENDEREVIIMHIGNDKWIQEFVGGTQLVRFSNFTTAKGVMTTQTLRGIADSGALHWRGDKKGCRYEEGVTKCLEPLADGEAQEERAFKEFNEAFVNLLGRENVSSTGGTEGLTPTQMQAFTDFIMQLTMPPNPVRNLDDSLTSHQEMGKNLFMGVPQGDLLPPLDNTHLSTGIPHDGASCNSCHLLDENKNLFGTDKSLLSGAPFIKVPQLRNMYQKVGKFNTEVVINRAEQRPDPEHGVLQDERALSGRLEIWTLTALDADTFSVVGSVSGEQSQATVGDLYNNGHLAFRLVEGATGFVAGDTFVLETLASPESILGFGYLHAGGFPGLNMFPLIFFSTHEADDSAGSVALETGNAIGDFMMAFPSNVKPVVGQQVTINAGDFDGAGTLASGKRSQFDVLVQQAQAGNCDLLINAVAYESGNAVSRQLVGERWRDPAACAHVAGSGDDVCIKVTRAALGLEMTDEVLLQQIRGYQVLLPENNFFANGVTLTCGAPGSIGQVAYYSAGGTLSTDFDNDGVANADDAYPTNAAAYLDSDGDGLADLWNPACDQTCQEASGLELDPAPYGSDQDADGMDDDSDNCPETFNTLQADLDQDGQGNACDYNIDNDGDVDANDRSLIMMACTRFVDFSGHLTGVPFNVPVLKPECEFKQWMMNGNQ